MKTKKIASRSNPDFKRFTKLLGGKGIRKQGLALLAGPKQVREVLTEYPERIAGVLMAEGLDLRYGEFVLPHIPLYELTTDLFRDIDPFGTNAPILIIKLNPFSVWRDEDRAPGCTLLIPFQDPANVGAVIRTAVAFEVSRIVLLSEAAHPFHPKSLRAAGSAILKPSFLRGPSIREMDKTNNPVIVLAPGGRDIAGYKFPSTFALMPGIEGPGFPESPKNAITLGIPMTPGVESLNAAMATGIALYVWHCGLRVMKT